MKTTLDLPPDVARTLRLESARRGGRRGASLSKLVAAAVREVYRQPGETPATIDMREGRVVVKKASGVEKIDREDIGEALDD